MNITHWMKRGLATALVALITLIAVPSNAAETITYIHWDALGSPVAATDESGTVVWRESYRPYGERIDNDPAADANSRWYTGHPQDADTGLVYAGARYYDPVIGRFLGKDPVGFQEDNLHSFNRYAYANNNPYAYVDPDGRNGVAALGGLLVESYNWSQGRGFNGGRVWGALKDGYNGEGDGFVAAAVDDILTIGGSITAAGAGIKVYRSLKAAREVARGTKPLLGKKPRFAKSRTNTELPGDKATAKSIFRNQTKGKRVNQNPMKNGGVRRTASDGAQIRINPDGSTRLDLPNRGPNPPGRETIHIRP